MSFKKTMVGAALTLSMAPMAALADGYQSQAYSQYAQPTYAQPQAGIAVGEPCPTDRQGDRTGRYELRTTQRFVQAQYQQVWVPEQCSLRERQRGWWRQAANVCVPAHYDQRLVPAHYESAQQWVWVSFGGHGHGGHGRFGHWNHGR
ncbi:MAG TPA: hypothetical protein VIG99_27020 [Myxococcaceae bacterium]|jgi:hypothetical protein